jgi:hypothetical protein
MPKSRAALLPLALALAIVAPRALLAADFRVDDLELLSHGTYNSPSGAFDVGSLLYFDLSLEGGDKFSGLLRMDFLNGDVENALNLSTTTLDNSATNADLATRLNNLLSPNLETVAITAKSVFDSPVDVSYFVGQMDKFCTGDDFVSLFGAAPFATDLRGPMVYPDGVGNNPNLWYDGIYQAEGTGFRFGTTPKLSGSSIAYAYLYQDSNLGTGHWSADLRYLFNSPAVKTELFAGMSTGGPYGYYRGGLLFYATSGDVGEFYTQAGLSYYDPSQPLSLDNIYFLFEPRINFGIGQAAITVFYHPAWYLQQYYGASGEKDAIDAAFNLRFGHVSQSGAEGGLQTLLEFRPLTTDTSVTAPLTVDASPYYALITGGVRWDFKLQLRLFPFPDPWYGMFMPFIGVKTSY